MSYGGWHVTRKKAKKSILIDRYRFLKKKKQVRIDGVAGGVKHKKIVRIGQVLDELWGVTHDLQESLKKPKKSIISIDREKKNRKSKKKCSPGDFDYLSNKKKFIKIGWVLNGHANFCPRIWAPAQIWAPAHL